MVHYTGSDLLFCLFRDLESATALMLLVSDTLEGRGGLAGAELSSNWSAVTTPFGGCGGTCGGILGLTDVVPSIDWSWSATESDMLLGSMPLGGIAGTCGKTSGITGRELLELLPFRFAEPCLLGGHFGNTQGTSGLVGEGLSLAVSSLGWEAETKPGASIGGAPSSSSSGKSSLE